MTAPAPVEYEPTDEKHCERYRVRTSADSAKGLCPWGVWVGGAPKRRAGFCDYQMERVVVEKKARKRRVRKK